MLLRIDRHDLANLKQLDLLREAVAAALDLRNETVKPALPAPEQAEMDEQVAAAPCN
ncbi:hypothetical protein IHN32_19160 [Deinococcus sp. 14RED07]|nr:hypothetical protein [Deinococcus sp. 14RED07]